MASPEEVEHGGDKAAMFVAWEDLTVVIPNFGEGPTKRLLNGVSGCGEPNRILAIMGPSGSGKSTLLDALAGRLAGNVVMSGNVLVNGKKRRLDFGASAYVTQEDVLLGTLTVRESITYSAHLRLPSKLTRKEISDIVEATITEMGLQDCSDRAIGNWHMRGISGGEKKRLSIALEVLTKPSLLFLDEPTSGLDSASAFFVVQILRNIASNGKTVVSAIHQPSGEVFALFDDLLLLSGGETVYFGDAKSATKFFSEAGFPCPSRRNPSDHFLRCVNSDFDDVTATMVESQRIHDSSFSRYELHETSNTLDPLDDTPASEAKTILVRKFKCSEYAAASRARIQDITSIKGLVNEMQSGSQTNWWKQLRVLTQRSLINMSRDLGYYWIRIGVYVVLSICVGSVFFNVGKNHKNVMSTAACGGFMAGFMTFMSIGGFQSFIEEMKVFSRERLNGHYGVAVYTMSNLLSSLPFIILMCVSTTSITNYMVKFQPSASHFFPQSLALSSPNRDHDDPPSTDSSIAPRNLDGSPSAPVNETLIVHSPVGFERGDECNGDAQSMVTESQIPPLIHCESNYPWSQAPEEIDDSFFDMCSSSSENRQQWTPNVSPGHDTDDELTMGFLTQPLLRLKEEPPKIVEPSGVGAGLLNLGNSCFVNSVLQCFTHTVPLIECLYTYKPQDPCNCGNEGFCVIKALRSHIEAALTTSRFSISPFYFLNNLNYFSPHFQRYQQEDAHEFLQAFLDKLKICCLDRTGDQDANLVQHVFGGRLVSALRCCNCNSVSETFENSLGLSLEIEDVEDLWSALYSFTCLEKLEEQMTCDNCKEKVSKEKQLLLDQLPMIATFHLKRFKNNGVFMEKIFKHVEFPLELDLRPYMRNNQDNEVNTKYHLYALVNHFGSLAYGHYYSYVRSAPTIWHRFDDKQVTRIDEGNVIPWDSYILFYAREGTPWFSRALEEIQPLLEPGKYSSPKSVLDPSHGECLSEISNEKPCDSAGVSDLHVKTEENFVSLSNESNEAVFQSVESSGEDSPMIDILDPRDPADEYDSCIPPYLEPSLKKELDSCLAAGDDAFVSLLMSEQTVQIELEQLENTKSQEEEDPCKQTLLLSDVADSKETETVHMKKPLPHGRELDQAVSQTGSPPKKLKTV